jgi:hypothetical protein
MKINSFLHPFPHVGGKIHNSIVDLHIDEVVDNVVATSDSRRFITDILYEFEQNEENLIYRQEIIQDFLVIVIYMKILKILLEKLMI